MKLFYTGMIVAVLLLAGCSGVTKVTDIITKPTAREVYKREFKDNEPAYSQWQSAYNTAVNDSLEITLPYGEKGKFIPYSNTAYSYTFTLQEGEVLNASVIKDSVNQRVFLDVFEYKYSGFEHVEDAGTDDINLRFEPKTTGVYKIIIQPELVAGSRFFIKLTKEPVYGFPVSGKGNADIGSFWGVDRDGGKRRHEGIDIFAKRGTPVVAVTDGTISRTGNHGLGGKQVWQRAGLFGNALYYAHLDSIAVQPGMKVKTGDTLGFVGNTGNAKFTPSHLHFGIYKAGAVNPLPFVFKTKNILSDDYKSSFATASLKVKSKANLRKGPSVEHDIIGSLSANEKVVLLGQHNDWLHILTPESSKAFLHRSLVSELN